VSSVETAERPGRWTVLSALYGLVLRTQVTLGRVLGIAALGALAVVLGLFAALESDDSAQAVTDAISTFGLAVLVPLGTLWLGTAAIGDLIEDRLLVYVWLKPVPPWALPLAAVLATATVVVPLAVLPVAASAVVAGESDVAAPALAAALLAALAYSGVFVAAGLWFKRAVWWGLAFVLLWENLVANISDGVARFTVVGWAGSILSTAGDVDVSVTAGSATAAFVILPLVAVIGCLAATYRYRRTEVD
jgi:ABC-2 type transport system permease protein